MTLTTLSSKEFKTLFKWAFRRNRTIMIIFSVLMGLGLILNVYAMAVDSYDEDAVPITLCMFEAGAAFFTFVSALKTFSFLHNKRSVDMFGAFPADRVTMFVSHLLAGISSVALPFSVGSVIIMGLATRSGETFKIGLFMIFTSLLMILAAYTFTALIAYCCGTVIDTAIVTIASNAVWVGIIALYFGLLSEIIPGFSFENIVYSPVMSALAPYGFSIVDIIYYYESSVSSVIANIVWQLVFITGVFFVAVYVCRHRKAESSQNGFAFEWLPMVIKAGSSIVAGGFIGFIAAETAYSGYTNMYIFAFWYAIIGFTAYFILHIIFSRGLKGKFKPQAIVFGSATIAVIILVFSMSYGLGIDTYVPEPNAVKQVVFDNCVYTEPENVKLVAEVHQLIADGIREREGYPYYIGGNDEYDYQTYESRSTGYSNNKTYKFVNACDFTFEYKRKFGFSAKRSYYISGYERNADSRCYDLEKMDKLIAQLRNSTEYKKSLYPELFDEEYRENLIYEGGEARFYIYTSTDSADSTGYITLPNDEGFLDGLLDAYKKDLINDKYIDVPDGSGEYLDEYIELEINYQYKDRDLTGHYYYDTSRSYIVKDSYSNTADYLEKNYITRGKASSYTTNGYENMYYGSYSDFGYYGEIENLWNFINEMGTTWEYSSCLKADVENYSKWHNDNYLKYIADMKVQANILYKEYINDESYFDPSYTNDYIREYGEFGEYFQLEDKIIEELEKYSDEYVKNTLK